MNKKGEIVSKATSLIVVIILILIGILIIWSVRNVLFP